MWRNAFLISLVYFVFGNIVGSMMVSGAIELDSVLDTIFFPYTTLWGLCAMVGWDGTALLVLVALLAVGTVLCLPLGAWLAKPRGARQ